MTATTRSTHEVVEREIDAVMRRYEQLVEKKDASALAGLYAQDARLMPPDAPVAQGRKAIRRTLQAFFDAGFQSMRLETVRLDVVEDFAIKQGTFESDLETGRGTVTVVGKDIEILRRHADGSWTFVADIFNLDAPLGRLVGKASTAEEN